MSSPDPTPAGLVGRPHLTAWMAGAKPTHPLTGFLASPATAPPRMLDAVEQILSDCDKVADPLGLDHKRRGFAALNSKRAFLDLRFELAVAAKLARAGEQFTFDRSSVNPAPDFTLTSSGLGVEATTKAPEGVRELLEEMDVATAAMSGAHIEIVLAESATRIPPAVRATLIEDVCGALASMTGSPVRTPARSYNQAGAVDNELYARISPVSQSHVSVVHTVQ